MKRFKDILLTLLPVIAGFLTQIIVSVIGVLIISFKIGVEAGMNGVTDQSYIMEQYTSYITSGNAMYIISIVAIACTAIIFPLWYYFMIRKQPKLEYKKIFTVKNVILLLVGGVVIQVALASILTAYLPFFEKLMTDYSELMGNLVSDSLGLTILLTVILAPIAEESIFRGLTLGKAKTYMPLWVANVVQAVLFGIYHGQLVQGVYAFIMGMAFGYVAIKCNSILPAIVLHMVVNGSALFVEYLLPSAIQESVIGLTVVGIIGIAVAVVMLKFMDKYEGSKLQ